MGRWTLAKHIGFSAYEKNNAACFVVGRLRDSKPGNIRSVWKQQVAAAGWNVCRLKRRIIPKRSGREQYHLPIFQSGFCAPSAGRNPVLPLWRVGPNADFFQQRRELFIGVGSGEHAGACLSFFGLAQNQLLLHGDVANGYLRRNVYDS